MKTIVAGGRNFDHYPYLEQTLYDHPEITEVVCGEARGADTLGKEWALDNKVPVASFPANWKVFGPRAGPMRNIQMGDYADQLVAFWDRKSRGTEHMINYMKSLGKPVHIYYYERNET